MNEKTNLLKNWTIRCDFGIVRITGQIFNDIKKRFVDGTPITTSQVLKIDFVNGIVETRNSIYYLDMEAKEW